MCGLVGMTSSFLAPQEIELFNSLLISNHVRGVDGTGVGLVGDVGIRYYKAAMPSYRFVADTDYLSWLYSSTKKQKRISTLLGHNRAATIGKISNDNSHPFVQDNVLLSMNGTIYNIKHLESMVDKDFKYEVDSDLLTKVITTVGIEEAIKNLSGGFCLTYVDGEEGTLNIIRNSERPLTLVKDSATWIWASEEPMLRWLYERGRIVKKLTPIEVKPGTLYTLNIAEPWKGFESKELELYKTPVITPVVRGNSWDTEGYWDWGTADPQDEEAAWGSATFRRRVIQQNSVSATGANDTTAVTVITPKDNNPISQAKAEREERTKKSINNLIELNAGISIGDRVSFHPYCFTQYETKYKTKMTRRELGKLSGFIAEGSYPEVDIHCIDKGTADELIDLGLAQGEVIGATKKDGKIIVLLSSNCLSVEEEDQVGNGNN